MPSVFGFVCDKLEFLFSNILQSLSALVVTIEDIQTLCLRMFFNTLSLNAGKLLEKVRILLIGAANTPIYSSGSTFYIYMRVYMYIRVCVCVVS